MKKIINSFDLFKEDYKTIEMEAALKIKKLDKTQKFLRDIIEWIDKAEETAKKYADNMMDITNLLDIIVEKTAENDAKKCQIYANGVHQGSLIGENNNH